MSREDRTDKCVTCKSKSGLSETHTKKIHQLGTSGQIQTQVTQRELETSKEVCFGLELILRTGRVENKHMHVFSRHVHIAAMESWNSGCFSIYAANLEAVCDWTRA